MLKSVSLTIKRGEKAAFVGESGSGKSTLTKILVGLLKYEAGNILFDSEPLKNISLDSLYEKVSYLSQDTPVFDGTIKENLVFDNAAVEADIHECLANTQLRSMLAALDHVTESVVMKNVLKKLDHATVIVVAHRLSSVSGFDKIFVFRNGEIAGNGTFEELLANNSYFLDLYRKEKENAVEIQN